MLEMVAQVPLHLNNRSSEPESDLHMIIDKTSDSSGLQILYCCGNNELAIYFEPGFTAGFIVCLLSRDLPCFINMASAVFLNIQLDFFLEIPT